MLMVRSWWVNQSESRGGRDNAMVWAPSQGKNGKSSHESWQNLLDVSLGDLIFHYTDRYVVGISQASGLAQDYENPYGDNSEWRRHGWRVPVRYEQLSKPIHITEIPEEIRQDNHKSQGGPFNVNLNPVQAYLLPVKEDLAEALLKLIGFNTRDSHVALFRGSGTLDDFEATDRLIQTLARVEQQKLRSILLNGAASGTCGLCGLETNAKYLVAAHIKPRSLCSNSERRDPSVAMLACVFGCDASFEIGGMKVMDDGRIFVEEDLRRDRPDIFNRINGSMAPAFTQRTKRYFEAKSAALED